MMDVSDGARLVTDPLAPTDRPPTLAKERPHVLADYFNVDLGKVEEERRVLLSLLQDGR